MPALCCCGIHHTAHRPEFSGPRHKAFRANAAPSQGTALSSLMDAVWPPCRHFPGASKESMPSFPCCGGTYHTASSVEFNMHATQASSLVGPMLAHGCTPLRHKTERQRVHALRHLPLHPKSQGITGPAGTPHLPRHDGSGPAVTHPSPPPDYTRPAETHPQSDSQTGKGSAVALLAFTDTERPIGDAAKNPVARNPDNFFDAERSIGQKFADPIVQSDMRVHCLGVWRNNGVEIIANDQGNRNSLSYLALMDTERLIGDAVKNQFARNWPFIVFSGQGNKPMIEVTAFGEERNLHPEEIYSKVILNIEETAEAYLGGNINDAVGTAPKYMSGKKFLSS